MMKNSSDELGVYKRLSRSVLAVSRRVELLQILEPVNTLDEKIRFFSGRIHQPKFEYKSIGYSPSLADTELAELSFPADPIGHMLNRKAQEVYLSNQLVINRGNRPEMVRTSKALYGVPSKSLLKKAESIAVALKDNGKLKPEIKELTSKDVAPMLRQVVSALRLKNWEVVRSRRQSSAVNVVRHQIKVSMQKHYSRNDVYGLIAHEIFGHVYRSMNGSLQPLSVFGTGLPGYLATEEGLATYLEEKYGVLNSWSILRHALKVIAVDSVYKNFCFEACFNRLIEFGADEDLAWELTVRVFRGGGFLKDHLYLQGYFEVKRWLAVGGDMAKLYVGKIGLKDLPFCAQLYRRRHLLKPKYLPPKKLPKINVDV